jgi:quinol-cytochrome oxidoreductase complex cytochrome b subunit
MKRPPLTRRQKNGAAIAGAVGFAVLNIGLFPAGVLLVLGVFSSGAILFESFFSDTVKPGDVGGLITQVIAGEFHVSDASVPSIIVISCIVGAILVIGSIVVSIQVLRRHGVAHPAGVTWAGIAIAGVVHQEIVDIALFIGAASSTAVGGPEFSSLGFAVVSFAAVVILDALLGWLAWWWMAHAMRSRAVPVVAAAPQVSVPQI